MKLAGRHFELLSILQFLKYVDRLKVTDEESLLTMAVLLGIFGDVMASRQGIKSNDQAPRRLPRDE